MPAEEAQPRKPTGGTSKSAQTQAAIVAAALRLFRERGYDKTTMRAIADEAGVSSGNAYYYFDSKEHLVQAYYDQVQVQHAAAASDALRDTHSFAGRLLGVEQAWLEVARPYHAFAGQFFKNAAEPTSPLSPFSPESAGAREASIALFAQVLDGSDLKLPSAMRREMPELLWLMHMGIVLFWVHDRSPAQARTRALVSRAVPLVDRVARMSRLPVVRGVTNDLVELVASLRG